MTLMIDPHHIWNMIYNVRSNRDVSPTSPNTAPATKSNTHHWSSSHETLFTMRRATRVSLQLQQILRLPRKMNLMIDPSHKWNVIDNARSNMCHCPNAPNTAATKKWISWLILVTNETLFTMRGATSVIVQTHQILRLPRKMILQNFQEICPKQMKRHLQCAADPRPFREWNRQSATRLATEVTFHAHHEHFVLKNTTFRAPAIIPNFTECCACHEKWHFNFTKYCACHAKWLSWSILFTHETLFTMRGVTSVIVQTHQILRLRPKVTLIIDPLHTWNAIYNARSNKCHCPNSPNTAPATQNDSPKFPRNLSKTDETSFTMRGRSETIPRMKPAVRNPPRNRGYFSHAHHEHFVLKNTTFRAPAIIPNFTELMLRLPRKVTLQLHQILRLPRKMTLERHQMLHLPRKETLELHQMLHLPRRVTLQLHQSTMT